MKNRINKLPTDFVPLGPPYITVDEQKAVNRVLKSGILGLGPYLLNFEKIVAKFVGTKYAVATSSGTAGLHTSLVAAGIKSGDEVITSPFSFVASANSILYVGAKPVFADIDPVTLNIDPGKIERAITKKTKAILPVHIFGYPADYDKILAIARKYNLKIVEDACESLGAVYRNKKVGNFGNLSVFAFYPNKQITTGEGGVIVTNNKEEYLLLKSLVNQGRSDDGQWLAHDKLGFNYRMDEMSAAVGFEQMRKINQILNARRKVALAYNKILRGLDKVRTLVDRDENCRRSWQTYVIVLDKGLNRNKIMGALNSKKIQSKPYLPSIHLQPYYRETFGYKKGAFPISESISESSLALPIYVGMDQKTILRVCDSLKEIVMNGK